MLLDSRPPRTSAPVRNAITIRLPTLSVIIPVYNEAKTIHELLTKVLKNKLVNEILIIDDYSTDGTRQWLAQTQLPAHVRVFYHERNQGKGRAIRTAIPHVTQEYVIVQDADLEYDPDDYTVLLQVAYYQHTPVVYGSRFLNPHNRHSYPAFYWGGRSVTWVTNVLYRQRLTDEPTCYKLFNTAFLKQIRLTCERFEFCPEVTAKVAKRGVTIMEVPIRYYPRTLEEGKKISWRDGLAAIYTLIRHRF